MNKWARYLNQAHPYIEVTIEGKKVWQRSISVRTRFMSFIRPTRYNEKEDKAWIGDAEFELLLSLASNACLIEE